MAQVMALYSMEKSNNKVRIIHFPEYYTTDSLQYGLGSIYLSGRHFSDWRKSFIKEIEQLNIPVTLLSPTLRNKLNVTKQQSIAMYEWEHTAISLTNAIVFWLPKGNEHALEITGNGDTKALFGKYLKTDRTFIGREESKGNDYIDWLLWKEHQLYPAETIPQLAEMVSHWLRE
jgi:hypothetical protein